MESSTIKNLAAIIIFLICTQTLATTKYDAQIHDTLKNIELKHKNLIEKGTLMRK